MMNENPRIPEGINVSPSNPIKDLIVLSLGVSVAFLITVFVVWHSLVFATRFIPLSWENRIAEPFVNRVNVDSSMQAELQLRLDRILQAMNYEGETPIRVTVIDDGEVNAFATLGGNIFVLSGLLEQLESDIGIDMVLAHEAAHILHRDPIKAVTGTLGVSVIMAIVTGNGDFAQASGLMEAGNQLLFLSNSRAQERSADNAALDALLSLYGNIDGAEELFVSLLDHETLKVPAIFSSHPHPKERIENIRSRIQADQYQ
jgi:predicted Zn-dependent protease